jgi:hypothetical protein
MSSTLDTIAAKAATLAVKAARVANKRADLFAECRLPFKGNNLCGEALPGGAYAVKSYGWYVLYLYKDGRWMGNKDRYSVSTSKHRTLAMPVAREAIEWVGYDTIMEAYRAI